MDDQNSNSTGRQNPIYRILGNANQNGAHSEASVDSNSNGSGILTDSHANSNNNHNNTFDDFVGVDRIDANRSYITLESADGRDCCKNGCGCSIF